MIRLCVLGELDLRAGDGRVVGSVLSRTKRAALLVRLVLAAPGGYERRDTLVGLFWSEFTESRARRALSQALHVLRRGLGSGAIRTRGLDEVGVDPARVTCDAVEFEAAIGAGEPERALDLYPGHLLPGFHVEDAPGFERWLETERRRLRDLAVEAAAGLAETRADEGNLVDAVRWARRAVALAPLDEPRARRLIELLIRAGDPAAAAAEYEGLTTRLRDELEWEPSPETAALLEAVREARPPTAPPHAPRPSSSRPSAPAPSPPPSSPPPSSPAPPPSRSARLLRGRALVVVAVVAFLLMATAWVGGWRFGPSSTPADRVARVAVLPFEVRGDPSLGYLGPGMVDLLSVHLDLPEVIRALDPRVVLDRAPSPPSGPERAAALARSLSATHYMLGSLVEAGGRLELSATLYEADGRRAAWAAVSAEGEGELLPAAGRLARELVAHYSAELGDHRAATAALTAGSLEALRAYLEGEEALRSGRYNEAAAAFDRAARADTSFVLAEYRLGVAADWAGRSDLSREALGRAWAGRARLPERERLVLESRRARSGSTERETVLRALVTRYPDGVDPWLELADFLFHTDGRSTPVDEVRAAFGRVLELDPANPVALLHLARLEARYRHVVPGDSALVAERVDSLIRRAGARGADDLRGLELRALRAFVRGDDAAERGVMNELRELDGPTLEWMVTRTVFNSGRYRDGRRLAALLTEQARSKDVQASGHILAAILEAGLGRMHAANEALDRAAALNHAAAAGTRLALLSSPLLPASEEEMRAARRALDEVGLGAVEPANPMLNASAALWVRYLTAGLLDARLGDAASASAFADTLRAWWRRVPPDRGSPPDRSGLISAAVALYDDRPADALAMLREGGDQIGDPLLTHVMLRGLAHERLGQLENALAWYGAHRGEQYFALVHDAPSHLRRAEILEALGRPDKAARHYARFVELWRDADPALQPQVERARVRLSALAAER